ncbi:MAG: hypothetical protein A6F71_05010 [Cycloclasticus sp. symbiont of Poecilosclerida sp. M]|nr:MAG: hypothetical protein A6F71_05010 [Cycloclasticus sp. symbiont of Poecilosclerida sp. M]
MKPKVEFVVNCSIIKYFLKKTYTKLPKNVCTRFWTPKHAQVLITSMNCYTWSAGHTAGARGACLRGSAGPTAGARGASLRGSRLELEEHA